MTVRDTQAAKTAIVASLMAAGQPAELANAMADVQIGQMTALAQTELRAATRYMEAKPTAATPVSRFYTAPTSKWDVWQAAMESSHKPVIVGENAREQYEAVQRAIAARKAAEVVPQIFGIPWYWVTLGAAITVILLVRK
jgi:hypothetical protein